MLKRLRKEDFENIKLRYEKRYKEHGASCETLGWKDEESQRLRFKILSEIDNLNGATLLDVGCAFGDLYRYLRNNRIKVHYTGVDIFNDFVEIARKRYPDAIFMTKNIMTEKITQKYDYVFLSGVLNTKISNNYEFAKAMMKKMYFYAKKGISANMLTDYVDFKEEDIFYYSPEKIFSFCKKLSRYVVLRHDYPLFEFTVYVYKRNDQ
jgi:SAM-dependent methyltransferase